MSSSDSNAGSGPLNNLQWRDEILQVMFWYRGEGFGQTVTARELTTFLTVNEEQVREHLERISGEGYIERVEPIPGEGVVRYQLTEWGIKEGGRRFADEFLGLTGQAHGECNNPDCECKTMGPEACANRH